MRPPDAQMFFELSNDLLAVLDGEGRFIAANPAWEAFLDFPREELHGRSFLDLLHEDDVDQLREALTAGTDVETASRWKGKDGAEAWVRWSIVRVSNPSRVYALGRDVTSLLQLHDGRVREAQEHEESELRLQLARELHDGILQTLTGASLQLAAIRRTGESDPGEALQQLRSVGASLAQEQKELRLFVEELRPEATSGEGSEPTVEERLRTVLQRVRGVWDMDFTLRTDGVCPPPQTIRTLARLVKEASVNSVRHGSASHISVSLAEAHPGLVLKISDNGSGFPFLGALDHDELRARRLGPLSLKHRVEDAGWRLSIDSSPDGSTITVCVPLNGGTRA